MATAFRVAGREAMSRGAPITPRLAPTIGQCAQRLLGISDAYLQSKYAPNPIAGNFHFQLTRNTMPTG